MDSIEAHKNCCKRIFLILFLCVSAVLHAQSYVGEVLYGNTYQYAKITITDSLTTFSLPFLDSEHTFTVSENIKETSRWNAERDDEIWYFEASLSENKIMGVVQVNGVTQEVVFYEQQEAIPTTQLETYEGVFKDDINNRVIVYARNGYLHIMSPFSERTMSLKPIGAHTFWSVSGEITEFKSDANRSKNTLTLQDRFNSKKSFKRLPSITIEEAWIPVGIDTLYAKLFIPQTAKKVPACLVLPGGGPTGMDNYEYEARFFAANGMISMVFDKSGNGKSKGVGNFNLQTFEEKTKQYLKLFSYLQNHPKVDRTKVGVHGPSEGGRLALMMAIDEPEIAFVNATAAPIMNMREGQLYAVNQHLRNRGISETDNLAVTTIWNAYYEGIIEGAIDPKIIEKANLYREKYERLFLPPNSTVVPSSPSKEDLLNDSVATEAGKISCPVFLQYGENDGRVNANKSIQNFMKYSNKELPVSVKLYPRGNHSMMTPEFEISHGYADDKRQWLQKIGIL